MSIHDNLADAKKNPQIPLDDSRRVIMMMRACDKAVNETANAKALAGLRFPKGKDDSFPSCHPLASKGFFVF